jgi:NAD(P)-dependent dehydrogenase (short-subunit alcohol dehydrogenase family)
MKRGLSVLTNGNLKSDHNGKVAVITGSNGILGSQLCRDFLDAGCKVVGIDLQTEGAESVIAAASDGQSSIMYYSEDISRPEGCQAVVEEIVHKHGQIDILINNAATKGKSLECFIASSDAYSAETWDSVLSVNLGGAFWMARNCAADMRRRGRGGSIVNVASIYGILSPDFRIYENSEYNGMRINSPAVYSASKAGLIGLTRYLACEWGAFNVRVNAVAPGGIQSGQNKNFVDSYSARVPLGRMARVQEISSAIQFLASESAAYITGQTVAVDGGLSAW